MPHRQFLLLVALLGAASAASAEPPPPDPPAPARPRTRPTAKQKTPSRIAWYPTWAAAKAAARRELRPILLVAAAPHCHGVSGIW